MSTTHRLDASYAWCRAIARRSSSSFYYGFLLLPREKRAAMMAIYAWMRLADDLADGLGPPAERKAQLQAWRSTFERALAEGAAEEPYPALLDTLRKYAIPPDYLRTVIDGMLQDVDGVCMNTFGDLAVYCYRVATVVGLASLRIWGYTSEAALEPAQACGLAFQLTNILRDVPRDLAAGRCYLPADELARFSCTPEQLRQGPFTTTIRQLFDFQVQRARGYFLQGRELRKYLLPDGRRVFDALVGAYATLLEGVSAQSDEYFQRPVRLPKWRKLQIAARSFVGWPVWPAAWGPSA